MSKTNILLETGTNEFEVVEFEINYVQQQSGNQIKQSFGVNVAKVREIIRMPELTKMPNLPEVVYGVFRLRGDIYPAVDLCNFLYSQENRSKDAKMVIAEFNNLKVGFIVNEVRRIHRITWSQIVPSDSMQEFNQDSTAIIGLVQMAEHNILMLDVEKIVADIDPQSAIDDSADHIEKFEANPIAVTAEDSAVIRKMITDKLNMAGFKIDGYNDGGSCWRRLSDIAKEVENGHSLDEFVKIVISDIEMPEMDGYTLTKHIKTHPILRQIPVVLFSSIISPDLMHKGKSVGADAQMTKPQIGELLEVVRTLINNKELVNLNEAV
ncbi:MAG: chemotaxis protein [Ignavibacteria bacterium]|jgi:two-component system chemotaxis response regulator CheV|nr:chemotaxis protein [Ignavibacteria bacterium]